MDKEKRPGEPDKDKADVEEVISDFGDVRLRSQFEIVEQGPGVLDVSISGPSSSSVTAKTTTWRNTSNRRANREGAPHLDPGGRRCRQLAVH